MKNNNSAGGGERSFCLSAPDTSDGKQINLQLSLKSTPWHLCTP